MLGLAKLKTGSRGLGEEREKGREGQEEEGMQCGRWGKETWEQLEMGWGLHSGKV